MIRWTRGSISIGADLTDHITVTMTIATDLRPGTGRGDIITIRGDITRGVT